MTQGYILCIFPQKGGGREYYKCKFMKTGKYQKIGKMVKKKRVGWKYDLKLKGRGK